ncbi:hypothetical protein KA107_03355 [Candidatus Pacearchaeota archaeon]|nr:hypothetical protein [Candidatus Pacearchaeota archaeon]
MVEKKFNVNALALQYGQHYQIARITGEEDSSYRARVASELRSRGSVIEAHEALTGRRYDEPNQELDGPALGVFGALAQALNGRDYSSHDPQRQLGDDIAVGRLITNKDETAEAIKRVFSALGPEAGIDLLTATRGKK